MPRVARYRRFQQAAGTAHFDSNEMRIKKPQREASLLG